MVLLEGIKFHNAPKMWAQKVNVQKYGVIYQMPDALKSIQVTNLGEIVSRKYGEG